MAAAVAKAYRSNVRVATARITSKKAHWWNAVFASAALLVFGATLPNTEAQNIAQGLAEATSATADTLNQIGHMAAYGNRLGIDVLLGGDPDLQQAADAMNAEMDKVEENQALKNIANIRAAEAQSKQTVTKATAEADATLQHDLAEAAQHPVETLLNLPATARKISNNTMASAAKVHAATVKDKAFHAAAEKKINNEWFQHQFLHMRYPVQAHVVQNGLPNRADVEAEIMRIGSVPLSVQATDAEEDIAQYISNLSQTPELMQRFLLAKGDLLPALKTAMRECSLGEKCVQRNEGNTTHNGAYQSAEDQFHRNFAKFGDGVVSDIEGHYRAQNIQMPQEVHDQVTLMSYMLIYTKYDYRNSQPIFDKVSYNERIKKHPEQLINNPLDPTHPLGMDMDYDLSYLYLHSAIPDVLQPNSNREDVAVLKRSVNAKAVASRLGVTPEQVESTYFDVANHLGQGRAKTLFGLLAQGLGNTKVIDSGILDRNGKTLEETLRKNGITDRNMTVSNFYKIRFHLCDKDDIVYAAIMRAAVQQPNNQTLHALAQKMATYKLDHSGPTKPGTEPNCPDFKAANTNLNRNASVTRPATHG